MTVDRTKAAQAGFSARDVANSMLVSLSGSFQTTPSFFLNWQNRVNYNLVTQAPQYTVQSLHDLHNLPLSASSPLAASGVGARPGILADVATIARATRSRC